MRNRRRIKRSHILYPYIITTNDKGKRVLKGPYSLNDNIKIEEDRDKIDRQSSVIYLPTRNINAASSMIRNNVSVDDGIDEASAMRIGHDIKSSEEKEDA